MCQVLHIMQRLALVEETLKSVLETLLQYNLLFKSAGNIENIIPFLKSDIDTYGFFQSLLCSIALSEFTFAFSVVKFIMNVSWNFQSSEPVPSPCGISIKTLIILTSIEVPHQILTMASFTICMDGWAFLFSYFLLYVIINKFCYQRNWGHAVFKGVIQVKADFIIDTKTNRLIYLKAFLATSEVILLWILALASKFFGSLVKQDVAESPEMLTICSIIFLIRPFKLLLHSYVYRRNNFLASCQYGDVEILKKMLCWSHIDFNALSQHYQSGFVLACYYGQVEVVDLFLTNAKWKGINLNWQAADKLTGFHVACIRGNYETVALIMQRFEESGIDLFLEDSDGQTGFQMWPEIFIETDSEIQLRQL